MSTERSNESPNVVRKAIMPHSSRMLGKLYSARLYTASAELTLLDQHIRLFVSSLSDRLVDGFDLNFAWVKASDKMRESLKASAYPEAMLEVKLAQIDFNFPGVIEAVVSEPEVMVRALKFRRLYEKNITEQKSTKS